MKNESPHSIKNHLSFAMDPGVRWVGVRAWVCDYFIKKQQWLLVAWLSVVVGFFFLFFKDSFLFVIVARCVCVWESLWVGDFLYPVFVFVLFYTFRLIGILKMTLEFSPSPFCCCCCCFLWFRLPLKAISHCCCSCWWCSWYRFPFWPHIPLAGCWD